MATERLALGEKQVGGAARMEADLAVLMCSSGTPAKRAADFSNSCFLLPFSPKTSVKKSQQKVVSASRGHVLARSEKPS